MIKMKFVLASIFVALICVFGAVGVMIVDLLVHDESISEAINNAPQHLVHSVGDLFLLAWQYKFVTFIAFAIVIGILYVRRVPEVRNQ
jgi:uncharacterized membrane protein YgdD (TMEM256/DUF423 family)